MILNPRDRYFAEKIRKEEKEKFIEEKEKYEEKIKEYRQKLKEYEEKIKEKNIQTT
ncbi:hypothetical protein [Methanobrevibacter sp.]|uniref:hypothetical protein n=1 Tax=Methanobrevibacter sp. TaxID=66852 RepID=UPI003890CF38